MKDVMASLKDFLSSFEKNTGLRIITSGRVLIGEEGGYLATLVCEGSGGLYLCHVIQNGPTIDDIGILVPLAPDLSLSKLE